MREGKIGGYPHLNNLIELSPRDLGGGCGRFFNSFMGIIVIKIKQGRHGLLGNFLKSVI